MASSGTNSDIIDVPGPPKYFISLSEYRGRRFEFIDSSVPVEARVRHDYHSFFRATSFAILPSLLLSSTVEVEAEIERVRRGQSSFTELDLRVLLLVLRAREALVSGTERRTIVADLQRGVEELWKHWGECLSLGDVCFALGVADRDDFHGFFELNLCDMPLSEV